MSSGGFGNLADEESKRSIDFKGIDMMDASSRGPRSFARPQSGDTTDLPARVQAVVDKAPFAIIPVITASHILNMRHSGA